MEMGFLDERDGWDKIQTIKLGSEIFVRLREQRGSGSWERLMAKRSFLCGSFCFDCFCFFFYSQLMKKK